VAWRSNFGRTSIANSLQNAAANAALRRRAKDECREFVRYQTIADRAARKALGNTPDTVRFYERSGLLPKPSRTASGYRVYDASALNQVRFIRKAQSLGFSLNEIQRILNLGRGQGKETCRCVIAMVEATLSETETRLKELRNFRDKLATNLERWKRQRRGPIAAEFCALIEATSAAHSSAADSPRKLTTSAAAT
jgi:MerR family transcriptional regulator, copper efflux regulator